MIDRVYQGLWWLLGGKRHWTIVFVVQLVGAWILAAEQVAAIVLWAFGVIVVFGLARNRPSPDLSINEVLKVVEETAVTGISVSLVFSILLGTLFPQHAYWSTVGTIFLVLQMAFYTVFLDADGSWRIHRNDDHIREYQEERRRAVTVYLWVPLFFSHLLYGILIDSSSVLTWFVTICASAGLFLAVFRNFFLPLEEVTAYD